MKHAKHTSGPWTIDTSGMYLAIRGNLSDRKHAAHEEVVARPYHLDDAALIAAAPEMLEALEAICASKVLASKEHVDLAVLMIRALVKARGES